MIVPQNCRKEVIENELMLGQKWDSTIVQIIKAGGMPNATTKDSSPPPFHLALKTTQIFMS